MIRRSARHGRAGITLVEILISIMILGIGVISLATLFPIGMVRMRNAQRYTRSAFLFESAAADLGARDLLNTSSFVNTPINPGLAGNTSNTVGFNWYFTTISGYYNPWVQDTPGFGKDWYNGGTAGAYRGWGGQGTQNSLGFVAGEGLPCAYDPLWRFQTVIYPDPNAAAANPVEARFAAGSGLIVNGGLQRVTNLPPAYFRSIIETFVSQEDLILQESTGQYTDRDNGGVLTSPSTVVPDLDMNSAPTIDWRYSWFFTGRRTDALSGSSFDGDIAICENRQFGMDALPGAANPVVSGETVVEAVWGYSTVADTSIPIKLPPGKFYGSRSAMRTVLLRWPTSVPDPVVRVGGWIADVTYERSHFLANSLDPINNPGRYDFLYPGQRCHWYQVTKKTDVVDDPGFGTGGNPTPYRRMTVFLGTPLKARTLMDSATGGPVIPEAALVMPCVVNVVPRTVYTR